MDLKFLQQITRDLNGALVGGFVNKIHQPFPRELILRVRVPAGREKKLVLSADPQLGRLHLTDFKVPNPFTPPRFCAYLRAHLRGARITEVSCAPEDRVVTISTMRGPLDGAASRLLILEILGRDSNIIMVDGATNIVMECLHRIPQRESTTRVVLPGEAYTPPPGRTRRPDDDGSPLPMIPGITVSGDGKRRLTLHANPDSDEVFDSLNRAADAFYRHRLTHDMVESIRRGLASDLKKRVRSLDRRIGKIRADVRKLERFADLGHDGELLKANLHRVKKGMRSIEVTDWSTGGKKVVSLDPSLDPVENMQKLFKKAAKGKRGKDITENRLEHSYEEKRALEDQIFFIEQAQGVDALDSLARELGGPKDRSERKPAKKSKKIASPSTDPLHEFSTPSGGVAYVGKSGKGNDFLLRRKARKGDLWFHVKGLPGAHVLLPQRGNEPASTKDIEFSASLAVRFSKAKGKGKTEVMMADVKDISRMKGALPGQVRVRRFTTLLSSGEPSSVDDNGTQ